MPFCYNYKGNEHLMHMTLYVDLLLKQRAYPQKDTDFMIPLTPNSG